MTFRPDLSSCAPSSSSPFSPAPNRTTPHRTCRSRARTDGTAGPPSWRTHRARTRTRDPVREIPRGEFPLLPSPGDAKGARAATGGWPRHRPGVSSNGDAPTTSLPLRRLDRDPKGNPKILAVPHQPTWGIPPFLSSPPQGREEGEWEKREGGVKGEAAPRDAADGPRPEAARVRVEPYQSPREKTELSATGGRSEQSKEQGVTVSFYTAPPSPSGRQRLHHRPAVSVVAPSSSRAVYLPCLHACGQAFEPPSAGASSFPHERPSTRAAFVVTLHHSHPRPL
jgi:hypothetical protein